MALTDSEGNRSVVVVQVGDAAVKSWVCQMPPLNRLRQHVLAVVRINGQLIDRTDILLGGRRSADNIAGTNLRGRSFGNPIRHPYSSDRQQQTVLEGFELEALLVGKRLAAP